MLQPPLERTTWQILPTRVDDGPLNMALDEALSARAAETGCVLMRAYGWSSPVLSLGRHQRAAGLYDLDKARARGITFVRRPTGGRAVLHWREITYCVAAPTTALGSLRESYHAINRVLVEALRELGVAAEVASPTTRPPAPIPGACFEEPVAGEIVAGGRKLVGSAQWRGEPASALLQHGSILIDDDQALANDLLCVASVPPPPAATLRGLLEVEPSAQDFARALPCAVARLFGGTVELLDIDDALLEHAHARRAHYASDGWTWRR